MLLRVKGVKREPGNRGTGVWERVHSGNPQNTSKWLTKPSKRVNLTDLTTKILILKQTFETRAAVCCHWTTRFHSILPKVLVIGQSISG